MQEAKPVFSVFFSGLFLSVVSYAALNQQLSLLFLTKTHHLFQAIEALRILKGCPSAQKIGWIEILSFFKKTGRVRQVVPARQVLTSLMDTTMYL